MEKEVNDFKFEVKSPAKIKIKNIRGLIDVKKGKSDEIKVQVIKYPDTGNAEESKYEVIQESDNSVSVAVDFENHGLFRIPPVNSDPAPLARLAPMMFAVSGLTFMYLPTCSPARPPRPPEMAPEIAPDMPLNPAWKLFERREKVLPR